MPFGHPEPDNYPMNYRIAREKMGAAEHQVTMFAVLRNGEIHIIRPSLAEARREFRNLKIVDRAADWTVSSVQVVLPK